MVGARWADEIGVLTFSRPVARSHNVSAIAVPLDVVSQMTYACLDARLHLITKTHVGLRGQLVALRINLPIPFIAKAGCIWVLGPVGSCMLASTTAQRLLLQRRRPGTADAEGHEQRWKMHVARQLESIEGLAGWERAEWRRRAFCSRILASG